MRVIEATGLVAVGGILGASLRYGLGAVSGEGLAVTMAVNASGSFLLGMLLLATYTIGAVASRVRLVLGTGFCASFTTYSTFIADIASASAGLATAYLVGSYGLGFAGVLAGRRCIRALDLDSVDPPPDGDP